MVKPGRPEAGIEEYREWKRRLQRCEVSEKSWYYDVSHVL